MTSSTSSTPTPRKAAADRQLPRSTVDALKAAHAFRMPMPAAWGGPELPVGDMLLVIEELTYADGAAGWCAMIGCDAGLLRRQARGRRGPRGLGRPRPRHRRRRPPRPARRSATATAGGSPDGGRSAAAAPTPTGSWAARSSTSRRRRAIIEPAACPAWRTFVLPVDEVTIHDTWDPMGLAGTGQPRLLGRRRVGARRARHAAARGTATRGEPIYALPWSFIVKGAAVPIGLARRPSTSSLAIAPGKLVFPEFAILGDLDHLHDRLARSRALIASARTLIHDVVGGRVGRDRAHRRAPAGGPGRPALAMVHSATACRTAVDHIVDTATTAAIKGGSPIDRAHRDIVTASQHLVVNDRVYGMVGRVLMGKPAGVIMI